MKVKTSYYNFQIERNDGSLLLYNSRTGAIVFVDNVEQIKQVEDILKEPNKYIETDILNALFNNGFIISDNIDEIKIVAQNFIEANMDRTNLNITILPTEFCNFKCPYCFIIEQGKFFKMNTDTYDSIYKFILQYIEQNKQKIILTIGWFGGEPLLCKSDIKNFMKRLIALENKYENLTLRGKMVTNGYLLNYETFIEMYDFKIRNFQITLDGDEKNHDSWRILKDGAPTFSTIYNNLLDIKNQCRESDISISIRGNFLKSNVDSMKKLARKIIRDFKDDNRFDLSFRPVVDFISKKDEKGVKDSDYCRNEEAIVIQKELSQVMVGKENTSNRMFSPFPMPINKWCNVCKQNSFIIDPKGLVFACDSVLSDKEQSIGKIKLDGSILYNSNIEIWKKNIFHTDKYVKCKVCKLLPVCLGGCTRQRLLNGEGVCTWTTDMIENELLKYSITL